jgi:CRISPR/Cas system-associated protein Cas5 (RAMP superfamily)
MKNIENMVQIFRIGDKIDNDGVHIAIEFQLLSAKKDYKTLQRIVRGLLSEHGVESDFGIDKSSNEFSEFDYESMMPYMLLYTAPHDNRESSIKLMYPNLKGIKGYKNMYVNDGTPFD